MTTNAFHPDALAQTWEHSERGRPALCIGDPVIVRFSGGTFALGTVIPCIGQNAQPGDRPQRGSGIRIKLGDGREWVTPPSALGGHVRRLPKGGAER
ncbi:MAG: hypothetical protein EDM82_05835 [Cyanobacteria bacterium CYA]|nr:MAG: hypothetical protein EDM82_05835 [Cyanobacteria bacterium CYA]